ncbi:hypothetical protein EAC61_RS07855 [Enterococcus hirae]
MTRQEKNEIIAKSRADYLRTDLIYTTMQLNSKLTVELGKLEENKNSNITNRVIRLAEVTAKFTAKFTDLTTRYITDIDAIIQNTMGK